MVIWLYGNRFHVTQVFRLPFKQPGLLCGTRGKLGMLVYLRNSVDMALTVQRWFIKSIKWVGICQADKLRNTGEACK